MEKTLLRMVKDVRTSQCQCTDAGPPLVSGASSDVECEHWESGDVGGYGGE